jgi:c-di-AMP phosphodiesterase-like protein
MLNITGIRASFAICRIGKTIHISSRSDGSINVQLILEKIGGGGHYDMAGAQFADDDMMAAQIALKNAIDEYLDSIKG